jgi:sugar/nucleoside kinase (ribokinase family)
MQKDALDVVVVGNVGVDTNIYLPGYEIDFSVEANFTENLDYVSHAGGMTSRGYARLGKKTAFIGHVGDDHNGRLVRDVFAADGIDTRALLVDPAGTARSVNFVFPDGRRKNFYDGKGHMALKPDHELCTGVLRGARFAHFHIPNWARELLPIAKALGLTIACDLQDVVSWPDSYRADFVELADILFLSVVNFEDPAPLLQQFVDHNPQQIVVSGMGARGCALATAEDGVRCFEPVSLDLPVVDTNGAGDALAVGFLSSYLLEGKTLEQSIEAGQIAARHACTLRGTSSGLITAERLASLQKWVGGSSRRKR